jgi:predicted O-linked N-acetylglucosamine transferase (SPINDLY family)
MAGALLTAAGLPELITYNLDDYAALALALANDPMRCAALRDKLGAVRESGVLFDTPLFVRDLEARLQDLVAGLSPPQHAAELLA